jgi:DNA-binding LacI/PurR family transcriptional regulator
VGSERRDRPERLPVEPAVEVEPAEPRASQPPRARSGINDVARLAGVSRQTVSNVLNNKTGYTEETRTRVLHATAILNYRPNRAARSLRSQRTMQLGYHMPGQQLAPENAFVLTFLQALVPAAALTGHHVLIFTDHDDELAVFRELVAMRSVDGFILSGSRADDPRPRFLTQAGIPFAMHGRTAADLPQTWVDIDNVEAARAAVDHLAGRGYDHFAYVGYDGLGRWDVERVEGYRAGLAGHGVHAEPSIILGRTLDDLRPAVRRLLGRERPPNAIVTGSDVVAATVVNEAKSLGLRPGRDLGVTGFDGGFVRHMTEPTLTSVRIPVEVIAAELIGRCVREVREGPTGDPGVVVPAEIALGGSA